MNNWLNSIQNIILPSRCYLCDQPGLTDKDLCGACLRELPFNQHYCPICALPLPESAAASLCGQCLASPPPFSASHAPFLYQGSLPYLIAQLKFRRHPHTARLLAQLMAEHIMAFEQRPQCLIPVPLHPARHRERGFNQALELARHLSKHLSIPLVADSCIRQRDTAHQTELSGAERRKNLRHAFQVTKPIHYDHVAIIDDVMTTGATASALTQTLLKAGVESVEAWVCARASRDNSLG